MFLKNRLLMSAACAATVAGLCGPVQAQSADLGGATETVVVTGTRLGQADITAPTPVTAVPVADLQASAPSSIADALNNLPSMVQSGGQQNNSGSTATGKNVLNLRGLSATRTLVLLDGMRFPSTQNNNTVDTNILPQALVKRVDIVTGGASASYGSDAVAGAVNFVLDDYYEGLGGSLSTGVSQYGDNEEIHGSLNFGRSFLSNHLHVIGSVDYIDNFGAAGDSRPFRKVDPNVILAPPGSATDLIVVPNLHSVSSYGGYVASATGGTAAGRATVTNMQFNNNGQLVPYDSGTLNDGAYQNGGDGINTAIIQDVSRPLRRRSAFLRGQYDFANGMTFFLQGIYGHSDAEQNDGEFSIGANAPTIHPDNPYLNPTTAAQLTSLGITSLTITKYFPYAPNQNSQTSDSFEYKNNDRATTQVVMGGFTGKLGRFSWGASGQYGFTREYTNTPQSLNLTNVKLAADATRNASGQIVCRDTLTNPNDGCVPVDIFGTNNLTQAGINYITTENPVIYGNETESAEAHITGALFDLPAGPVAGAAGLEYRRQRDAVSDGPLNAAKVFQLGTVQPWQGGYDVSEGFFESDFPILANKSYVESLDVDLAARETYYSTGGYVTTWKAGVVYKVNDDLTFRATVSRDIRAPNPSDLFSGGSQGTTNVTDPFNGNAQDKGIRNTVTGNPNLRPEKGTTVTGGIAYSPSWATGLTMTVDYYDIRVAGVIATPDRQNVINLCFQGNASFCPDIQRQTSSITSPITGITLSSLNLNALRTDGIDLETDYNVPADDWFDWWEGTLSVRAIANYLGILTTNIPGSPSTYQAGLIGNGTPHWRAQAVANYTLGDWTTFLQMRFIGAGVWNNLYNNPTVSPYQTTAFNAVNSATYFDLQETYHVNANIDTYINIQNVFDLQPQFSPANSNYAQTNNESLYDQIGRMFRVGIRFKY